MNNTPTALIFTELTLREQASLSGGDSTANGGNAYANGGRGSSGGIAIAGDGGESGKNGRNGRVYKSGKLSKADRKVLRQTLANMSDLLSDLF